MNREFPAAGPAIYLVSCGVALMGTQLVNEMRLDLLSGDSEMNPISNYPSGVVLFLLPSAVVVVLFYIAIRMLISGVFLEEDELVLKQIGRTRRIPRSSVMSARVDASLLSKVTLELAGGKKKRFELYAKYKLPKHRMTVVDAINVWAEGSVNSAESPGSAPDSDGSMKYACMCCGYLTIDEMPPGTFDICPVCFWEDEFEEDENTSILGPNPVNLAQARRNFKEFGASEQRRLALVREPLENELPASD